MQNFFIGKLTKFVIKSLLKLFLNQTCNTSVFQSHNPKVGGSNPSRATKKRQPAATKTPTSSGRFVLCGAAIRAHMIQALIAGTLLAKPEVREGKNGSAFTLAKVRAVSGDGESLILNAIAFSPQASAALLALEDGDAVAVSGALTPKVWLDKQGNARPALDMIVNRVLAADLFEALQSTQG